MRMVSTTYSVRRFDLVVTIALFALALVLPALDIALKLDPTPAPLVNHKLAVAPSWPTSMNDWGDFPEHAEAWIDDRFGFRNFLIRFHNTVSVFILRSSPNDNIRLGPNNWLFLASGIFGQEGRALDDFQGRHPLTSSELDHWVQALEKRRTRMTVRGIRYLAVFVPNKATVYPEQLPMGFARLRGQTRLDQLIERLNARSFPVVDLRPALSAGRNEGRLYQTTGTHWNERGGLVGDGAIALALSRWFPNHKPLDPSAFRASVNPGPPHELAKMLGLSDRMIEKSVTMEPLRGFASRRVDAAFKSGRSLYRPPFAMERDSPELPRALVFHDSFFRAIAPFLSEHFSRTAFYWQYDLSPGAVEAERPDVVIQLMGERVLLHNLFN